MANALPTHLVRAIGGAPAAAKDGVTY
uniref:Uncharacterized protein n=1 Tax=Anguilla anguilla TaxID=7936 RepID=A0A0E9PF82_ANGAN